MELAEFLIFLCLNFFLLGLSFWKSRFCSALGILVNLFVLSMLANDGVIVNRDINNVPIYADHTIVILIVAIISLIHIIAIFKD